MPRLAAWTHTLEEGKRQALVAIDFYNRPGDRRSFFDFVIHMHLAWQSLLHADLMKRKVNIYYKDGYRYKRNPDGTKKSWELAQCLKKEFADNDPIRMNIDFFVGLRNRVEHRFQDAVLSATEAESHAYVINFETELVRRFGPGESLGAELRFPLFVQSLTPVGVDEQRQLRRDLPLLTSTYITRFEAKLDESVKSDERFAYRVLLIPMKGPKTEADMAVTYVRRDDLSDEELHAMLGKEGSVVIAEKYREVVHGNEMLPAVAAAAVEEEIPFKFSVDAFTRLRKKWEIGPAKAGSKDQLPRSDGFCVYSPAFKQFVYRHNLVKKMAVSLDTTEKYEDEMGRPAVRK